MIDENNPPEIKGFIFSWERGLDPWHDDAFSEDLKPGIIKGERKSGWLGNDWAGNTITFIEDGTPC